MYLGEAVDDRGSCWRGWAKEISCFRVNVVFAEKKGNQRIGICGNGLGGRVWKDTIDVLVINVLMMHLFNIAFRV